MRKIFTEFKVIVFALIILPLSGAIKAQDDCSLILERAERLFEQGKIEEIPSILAGCIRSGFSRAERMRAQRLVILSYMMDNKIREAEDSMLEFLSDNPEYEIQAGDPAEFAAIYSRIRTYPVLAAGIFIGGNITTPGMLEQFGPYNISHGEYSFPLKNPDFQIGAGLSIFLGSRLELDLEAVYTHNSFNYTSLQYGFAEISKNETYERLECPVSFSIDLGNNKLKPYLRLGASYGMVLKAVSDYRRTYVNTGSEVFSPVESFDVNITEKRKVHSFSVIGGAGMKYRVRRGDLFLDMRYYYTLTDLVVPEKRWDNEAVFSYYSADSDIMLDYFTVSIGFRYSFFKSKKL